ncbi:MAG: hypothetical protein GX242_03420 [Clostridiales bacterium]|jgi:glycerophosphoryl diester phosphodiesterase|nr:hypothetical protein [Clostridiales bacterium]
MIKNKKYNTIIKIIVVILFIILLCWYGMAAYIHVNSQISYGYKPGMPPRYVAHRGLSGEYFENSYDAFFYAEKSSFFGGIECDIWKTLDDVWVCCHDDTPFVDKTIKVTESKYDDIKNLPLDTSSKGENVVIEKELYITTYEQFLSIMRYSTKQAFVEIKKEYEKSDIEKLVDYTRSRSNMSKIVFISFHIKVMEMVQSYRPTASVMPLSNNIFVTYFLAKMGYNMGISKKIIDKKPSMIELVHSSKSFVYVYTVNNLEEANKYIDMGVDYIATDYILTKQGGKN